MDSRCEMGIRIEEEDGWHIENVTPEELKKRIAGLAETLEVDPATIQEVHFYDEGGIYICTEEATAQKLDDFFSEMNDVTVVREFGFGIPNGFVWRVTVEWKE